MRSDEVLAAEVELEVDLAVYVLLRSLGRLSTMSVAGREKYASNIEAINNALTQLGRRKLP